MAQVEFIDLDHEVGARSGRLRGLMENREFSRIVRIGLGRAIVVLQETDRRPYDDVILNACLHNLNYRTYLESSRTQYVWDLIQLSGDPARYRSAVLAALETTPIGADLDQLFELARKFAAEGNEQAKTAMYARFAANAADPSLDASEGELTTGAEEIILLDGIDGYLFVAEKLGQRALADGSMRAGDYVWDLLKQKVGAERALEQKVRAERARHAIELASQQSESVAAYIRLVNKDEDDFKQIVSRSNQVDLASIRYDALKQMIQAANGKPPGVPYRVWAHHADPADIERAARDLLGEQDVNRLEAYLGIFCYFAFPFGPEPVIALTQHDDPHVARAAVYALENIQHPLVRILALDMLAFPARANSDRAIHLLERNYEPGDHELIERRLAAEQDESVYHELGVGVLHVFEAHPVPECANVLTMLYENGPCTMCREHFVDLLHTLGRMPDWMLRECRYDANEELRAKVRAWSRGVGNNEEVDARPEGSSNN